ncbi:phage tail protein [Nostocoides sp. F2B08]|uniref:phage tail protein n=1 Tax=Nostocoides sp. F2B08 TaxID=2653936 RepID=UPI001263CD29|nr:tail fiber protein [Tetrasphaera sp. F2B08]KAB7744116.1 phage tail protein [Tetrasphaera sp. F2B08]
MSDPFLGEIKAFASAVIPRGWSPCDGRILPINQNQALFSLLGTTYGGDGRTTFALPDLRGRVPIHTGATQPQGTVGGSETVALRSEQLPAHTHTWVASSTPGDTATPADNLLAASSATNPAWAAPGTPVAMAPETVATAGGGAPHENMQPWLAVQYCIAVQGIFPSRN